VDVAAGSAGHPFVTYGKNAIAVYVGAGLLAKTLLSIGGRMLGVARSLWYRLYQASTRVGCRSRGLPRWAVTMVGLFYLLASGWTPGDLPQGLRRLVRRCPEPKPPVAKTVPHASEIHGERRVDDYAWLRQKEDPTSGPTSRPRTPTPTP